MNKIILQLLSVLILVSCERDSTFEGPALSDLYGEFKILEDLDISNRNIEFEKGETVYFTAQFSKLADWEIKITGKTSGAQKIITGKSRIIDATNSVWDGSTTIFPMFRTEECDVELSFQDNSATSNDNLTIISAKINSGFVVADFENGINNGWVVFKQSGADMSFEISNEIPAAQGEFYYDMGGAVDWDWLIGMIDFPGSAYGNPTFPLNSNPDNVYFNVVLYLPDGITNALVLFQFREDDNQDGDFDDTAEDMYSLELKSLHVGWQLISIKYSDLVTLVNGQPAEPNGNKIHNPERLWQVSTLMLADPNSGYSQVLMDYMIFTENTPLNP